MMFWQRNSYLIVFLLSFGFLVCYLTPNVNTGDAGELITASHYLALAHPSGYPLYLLIAKGFSLIPLGNIAFRVATASAVFSALSLVLVFWSIFRMTKSYGAAIFGVVLLFCSSSYVSQSVIAKFYPLNLFLILSVYTLWLHRLTCLTPDTPEDNPLFALQLTAFLVGLISATHHTGLIIIPPVALILLLWRRDLIPRQTRPLPVAAGLVALFLMGFAINLYLILRGGWDRFGNVFHVTNLAEFWSLISRQPYGHEGTVALAKKGFFDLSAYTNGALNFLIIIKRNFGLPSLLLFIPGVLGFFRGSPRAATLTTTALFLYGPVLTKLCLPERGITEFDYYIYAHQYFLPALAFYAIVAGFGFSLVLGKVAALTPNMARLVPWVFNGGLFALALLARGTDSNFASDFVPFETAQDTLSTLPVNSVLLSYGDNEKFQGRYLKLIGRYRDDVCLLNAVTLQGETGGLESCSTDLYGSLSSGAFTAQRGEIDHLVENELLFADFPRANKFPLQEYYATVPFGLAYQVLPKASQLKLPAQSRREWPTRRKEDLNLMQTGVACDERSVNDLFTDTLCDKYQQLLSRMTAVQSEYGGDQ